MHYDVQQSKFHCSKQCLADITPSSENSFRAPYFIKDANEIVKTSTMGMDTKRVKPGS